MRTCGRCWEPSRAPSAQLQNSSCQFWAILSSDLEASSPSRSETMNCASYCQNAIECSDRMGLILKADSELPTECLVANWAWYELAN